MAEGENCATLSWPTCAVTCAATSRAGPTLILNLTLTLTLALTLALTPHPNRNPQPNPNPNPNPNLNPSPSPNQAVVAFDLMTMPLRLLPALPALTPALLCVFAEELDDDAAGSATANAITSMLG